MYSTNNINSLVLKLVQIGNVALYLLIALGFLYVVWNVVMYIIKGSDPAAKAEHIKDVGWGIVGLAIIFSIWGIVNILLNTFFSTSANMPYYNVPSADFVNGAYRNNSYNFSGSNSGGTSINPITGSPQNSLNDTGVSGNPGPDTGSSGNGTNKSGFIDVAPSNTGAIDVAPSNAGVIDSAPSNTGSVSGNSLSPD